MENKNMIPNIQSTILLVGNDSTLNYLLGRFAERSGYLVTELAESLSTKEIETINPVAIIFTSMELFATRQTLVVELSSLDTPLVVCLSVTEEARARELGADYCLLHPLTYDDFQTALSNASASKHT